MKTCLAAASILTTIVLVSCAKKSDDANRPLPSDKEVLLLQSTEGCKSFVNRLMDDFKNQPGAFYDFISVHENSDDSSSPLIHIFYYGRMVEGQTPVVFFNGGPASDSHSSYATLTQKQRQDDSSAQIPFIFIDQRGTGCSDPYPQGSEDPILQRLAHYGSRGIVGDAEQIRSHLGVAKWKVFGQSYGAFIVHRYMTLAPQSITAAFAHAGIITSDPMERLTGRIRSQN